MTAAQGPPKGLGEAGGRLWRAVVDAFELDEHELALLVLACRTADRLEDIAEGLVGAVDGE